MRGKIPEILRTVHEVHKTELRVWGAALDRGRNKTSGRMQDWPDPQLRDTRAPTPLR